MAEVMGSLTGCALGHHEGGALKGRHGEQGGNDARGGRWEAQALGSVP